MLAGNLRCRVTIEQRTSANTAGVNSGTWTELCTVWGNVIDLSGREYFASAQAAADLTSRIVIRWRSDVREQMRARALTPRSRLWDIQSVIDPDGRKRELQLMCLERLGE